AARHAPPRRPLPPRPRQALPAHGQARAGAGAPHHRDDDVPRDGHDVLAGAGRRRGVARRIAESEPDRDIPTDKQEEELHMSRADIAAVNRQFEAAARKGDLDWLASSYTADGIP